MGVKIQKPGEPGHPGGNRRIYVRVNYRGRRKTRVFNTKQAAEAYASTVESILKDAELGKTDAGVVFASLAPTPSRPAVTFTEAAERWWTLEKPAMKGGTQDTYRNTLDKHLIPVFGERPIADITIADIEGWWAGLRSGKLSHKRLRTIRGILVGIFRRAVTSGLAERNPADAITGRLGREDREVRQAEWLTEPELVKLLTVAADREPRHHPILLTIASTGIRLGEAVGLQAGDVDLPRCKLSIRRAIRKRQVGSPKSGKPRTVDVPSATIAVLRGWLDVIRAEAAVRGEEACWLFPSATGTPVDEPVVRDALVRALKAAGIRRKLRVHHLRHTYASLALQRGVPLLTVSRQLGHGSIAITADTYGHLAPDATRQAADAWEAILGGISRNPGATDAPDAS